jgi:hypothetical protein
MGDDLEAAPDIDLVAAALRADLQDNRSFLQALAVRLEGALPGIAQVQRKRAGLLSRERVVQRVEVTLGDDRFTCAHGAQGLVAERVHVVRGIALKRETVPVERWIEELAAALSTHAGALAADHAALQRLLES